jgi:DNA-binding response OmpR family regulator
MDIVVLGGGAPLPEKILIADDEEKIARMVASYLEASGFQPLLAFDGKAALALIKESSPACLILDINMPGADGLDVAREVRKTSSVPIIFLTARTDETDRIVGLELGADDYVSKPFSPRELVARVRAVLRRSPARERSDGRESHISQGPVEVDTDKRLVSLAGKGIELTAIQFEILVFLMRAPGRVYSRLEILQGAVGTAYEGYERTLDAHIKNIRKALGDDSEKARFIGTVRGVGYKFIEQAHEA